jgi:hypothetical protein
MISGSSNHKIVVEKEIAWLTYNEGGKVVQVTLYTCMELSQ